MLKGNINSCFSFAILQISFDDELQTLLEHDMFELIADHRIMIHPRLLSASVQVRSWEFF